MSEKDTGVNTNIALVVAVMNLGLFGLMFGLMGYFELIGSDPAYYDEGTIKTVGLINSVLGVVGLDMDPTSPHKVSTIFWAVALGIALVSTCFAIMIANRKPMAVYETTLAKR
jgi:hypothetical protein